MSAQARIQRYLSATEGRTAHLVASVLIMLVTSILYLNSLHASFHLDDFRVIVDNPVFKFSRLSFSALVDVMASVRAVTMVTFALNYAVGGEDVFGYHVVNILLHGLTGIVLYALLFLTLTRTPGGMIGLRSNIRPDQIALWASLLWVAHPIQTQAVTYIVQRAAALAALFFLLTMLCYLKGRLAQGRTRLRWYLLGALTAVLALGSKEIAFTLPLVLWLYEACFFTPAQRSPLKANLGTLLVVVGAMGVISFIYVYGAYGGPQQLIELFSGRSDPYHEFSLWQRLLTKGRVVALYLSLLLVPIPGRLNLDHDMVNSLALWSPPSTIPAWLFVGATVALAMMLVRHHRFIGYWLLWFFLNIALESSIVSNELVFEHRLYLPSMGIMVGVVVAVVMAVVWVTEMWGMARWRTMVVPAILVPVLIGYGAWTIERNGVWENEITLWRDTAEKSPVKFRPRINLGYAYELDGQFEKARQEYELAKVINPSSIRPYHDLGWVYYRQREWGKAADEIEQALTLDPSLHYEALLRRLLGSAYAKQGREPKAIVQWERAYQLEPWLNDLPEDLGWAYLGEAKQWLSAQSVLQDAVGIHPESVRARYLLGLTLEKFGDMDQAQYWYREAVTIGTVGGDFVKKSRSRLEALENPHEQTRRGEKDKS